jgi:hypothetical protein
MRNYQELIIWQQSVDLTERCYQATQSFPVTERFGLTSQIRRSAISIPSNIPEDADGTRPVTLPGSSRWPMDPDVSSGHKQRLLVVSGSVTQVS